MCVIYVRSMSYFASQFMYQTSSVCIRISLIEIYFKCSKGEILYKQLRGSEYWENNSGTVVIKPVFYYLLWHFLTV